MHIQNRMVRLALLVSAPIVASVACASTNGNDEQLQQRGSKTAGSGGSTSKPSDSLTGTATQPLQCDEAGANLHAVMTADAPQQSGWFASHVNAPGTPPADAYVPPSCEHPLTVSDVRDEGVELHYQAYTFKNWSAAEACVSVHMVITPYPGGGNGWLQTAAYIGSFDPTNIVANYAADTNGGVVSDYSFKVPASTDFVVVVTGQAAAGDPNGFREPGLPALYRPYTLSVTGCGHSSGDLPDSGSAPPDAGSPQGDGGNSHQGSGSQGKAW